MVSNQMMIANRTALITTTGMRRTGTLTYMRLARARVRRGSLCVGTLVPTLGNPTTAWTHMPPSEQQDSIALTHAQRRGEDAKDCCLNDSVVAFSKQLKTSNKDMTIKKWIGVFTDVDASSSCILPPHP